MGDKLTNEQNGLCRGPLVPLPWLNSGPDFYDVNLQAFAPSTSDGMTLDATGGIEIGWFHREAQRRP